MALTKKLIESLKTSNKRLRRSDSGGLFIEVSTSGAKTWKLAYRFQRKQRSSVLGYFPEMGLAEARIERDRAKGKLSQGLDPFPKAVETEPATAWGRSDITWAEVAKEYRDRRLAQGMATTTTKKMEILIEKTKVGIGDLPIRSLTPGHVLPLLRLEEANGHYETATRLRTLMGQVFRYAIATGRLSEDPTRDLRGAILPPRPKHHAGLVDQFAVGGLMRSISQYDGDPTIRAAPTLLAHTFLRPGELRLADWSEITGDTWIVASHRMKGKRKHIVPLSRQAQQVINWFRPHSRHSRWMFPQRHNARRALSNGTMNAALRRMGYTSQEHVPHGFRTTASTNLNEANWNPDWIEAQLAHSTYALFTN